MKRAFSLFLRAASTDGIIFIVLLVGALLFFMMLIPQHSPSPQKTCQSNQKQIATAFMLYAQEHEGKFPPAAGWDTAIDVKGKILNCPANKESEWSYAYNKNLVDVNIDKIEDAGHLPLTADSTESKAIMDKTKDIAFRHKGKEDMLAILSFVDGHVTYMQKSALKNVIFEHAPKNNGK